MLDVETGRLLHWNAGHDAPMHRSTAVRSLDCAGGGPPLCVIEDFDYAPDTVDLAPGDLLVLYTDGISEAVNPAGEQYGRERLRALIEAAPAGCAARDLAQRIRDDLGRFAGEAEQADDITLLVVRWRGPGAVSAR